MRGNKMFVFAEKVANSQNKMLNMTMYWVGLLWMAYPVTKIRL